MKSESIHVHIYFSNNRVKLVETFVEMLTHAFWLILWTLFDSRLHRNKKVLNYVASKNGKHTQKRKHNLKQSVESSAKAKL